MTIFIFLVYPILSHSTLCICWMNRDQDEGHFVVEEQAKVTMKFRPGTDFAFVPEQDVSVFVWQQKYPRFGMYIHHPYNQGLVRD